MKIERYDDVRSRQHYDMYSRFHKVPRRGWVYFDTGEVIYTIRDPKPDLRGYNKATGVDIIARRDARMGEYVLRDPETGYRISRADLLRGPDTYFCIDVAQKRMVCLDAIQTYGSQLQTHTPAHLSGRAKAYWGGEGRPLIGEPVTYYKIAQPDEAAVKLIDQCCAWAAFEGLDNVYADISNGPEPTKADVILDGYRPQKKPISLTNWALRHAIKTDPTSYTQISHRYEDFKSIGFYARCWIALNHKDLQDYDVITVPYIEAYRHE